MDGMHGQQIYCSYIQYTGFKHSALLFVRIAGGGFCVSRRLGIEVSFEAFDN